MKCLVQVNGKVVYDGEGPAVQVNNESAALRNPAVVLAIGGREVKKVITIPNKLINIVARFRKQYEY